MHGYKQGWNIKCLKEYLGKINNIKSKKHMNRIMYKLEQFFKKSNTGKAAFQAVTTCTKLSLMKISSIWVTVVSLRPNTTKKCTSAKKN